MTEWQGKNLLAYGDNLEFLADPTLFPDACVDLIYLDPPFNSQQSYNVLFKEAAGAPAAAQIKAFEDTWTWDAAANEAVTRIHNDPAVAAPLVELMKTFMNFLKPSPMMAYLVQMAIRLVHMHRVLKQTGSLYLHCDPTASHYLKLVLDAIFGPGNFRNEIVWRRTNSHNKLTRQYGPIHDTLLFYGKSSAAVFHPGFRPYSKAYIEARFVHEDDRGRYQTNYLTGPGVRKGASGKAWRGFDPTQAGRHWAIPASLRRFLPNEGEGMTTYDMLEALLSQDLVAFPKKPGGQPMYKQYMGAGVPFQDIWAYQPNTGGVLFSTGECIDEDVKYLEAEDEKLGYQTQKPIGLLKRIVITSSNPGDVVLDPFCGCGTTIDAVETVNREAPAEAPRTWIGIDITHLSINLIKHRLTRFDPPPAYEVIGEPTGVSGAAALAQDDPFQFQFWALGLIGARPRGGAKKKGADQGIDGVRYFIDEMKGKQPVTKTILVQVKGGKVGAKDIRDFVGTLSREQAEMGAFITLAEPTGPMKAEAASAGMYTTPWDGKAYPKVQIVTIAELLADPYRPNPRCLQIPGGTTEHTLPQAPKHKPRGPKQRPLDLDGKGEQT